MVKKMMSRAKIPASLVKRIQAAPHVPVRAIIRLSSKGPAEAAAELRTRGIHVRYILGLVGAIAVEARGERLLSLIGEPWIREIEEDQEMRIAT